MAPQRFLDTRPEADHATMADGQTVFAQITGRAGIPADAVGVVANVTATNTTVPGFLTVFPDALPQPLTSSLNFVGGEPGVPNLVMSKLGAPGNIGIFNFSPGGTTDAIVDVVGYSEDVKRRRRRPQLRCRWRPKNSRMSSARWTRCTGSPTATARGSRPGTGRTRPPCPSSRNATKSCSACSIGQRRSSSECRISSGVSMSCT